MLPPDLSNLRGTSLVLAVSRKYRRLFRFLAVGVVNTAFGYGMFAVLYVLTVRIDVAVVGATVLGIFFNFFTTGRFVFGNRSWRALVPFFLAYGVALCLNLLILDLLVLLRVPPLWGQAICLPIVVAVSYLINARFVFNNPAAAPRPMP